MRVLLLDGKGLTKLELPEEVNGSFLLKYKPYDSKVVRELSVEAKDGKWVLNNSNALGILDNKNSYLDSFVLDNFSHCMLHLYDRNEFLDLYAIPTIERDSIRGLVTSNNISIGSTASCSIIYQAIGVKDVEAFIYSSGSDWYLAPPDSGYDGKICLNDVVIRGATKIKVGDIIFIDGLKMIWMKSFIQVCMPRSYVTFNVTQFQEYNSGDYDSTQYDPVSDEDAAVDLYDYDDYFFHTPNLNPKIEEAEITIDPSPASTKSSNDNTALVSAGSSLTMLASAFATGFNLVNNINNGSPIARIIPTAVTFLAMLIGSLLMPRIARAVTEKAQKKREMHRITKYSQYLEGKENEIVTEMNKQIQILNDNYSTLPVLLKLFYSDPKSVWNKEIKDDDFLEVRIGLGKKEAEIKITAPEEHFTLDDDALYNRIYDIVNFSRDLENVPLGYSFLKNRISAIVFDNKYKKNNL